MIHAYLNQNVLEFKEITTENQILLEKALWIDLISPTKEEEHTIEEFLGVNIPTREDMIEIELSSRLYEESNVLFMTAIMLVHSEGPSFGTDPATFVLTSKQLITIRYAEIKAFKIFLNKLQKFNIVDHTSIDLLIDLLHTTVDNLADSLEAISHDLEEYFKNIFPIYTEKKNKLDYQKVMNIIGINCDRNAKIGESLIAVNRLLTFLKQKPHYSEDNNCQLQITILSKDIMSLSDHANFTSTKINFLLEAILGMVSIEQNNIIKIFSVAAVMFLPPTLIASIYGMNFHFMPELVWKYGYLFALLLMFLGGLLPYKYFKYRKWL